MKELTPSGSDPVLCFADSDCHLQLKEVGQVDHGTAFGRIAFAVPTEQIAEIEKRMKETNNTIITPHVKLDTPGKATVEVVILGDPVSDDDVICLRRDKKRDIH